MRDVFTRATLQRIPGERWIVIVAFAAGLAFFGLELAEHVRAFFTGALTALVLMGVLGFAKGQWQGREVEEVGVPGVPTHDSRPSREEQCDPSAP